MDKNYCMSHFLAFRYIKDENRNFYAGLRHKVHKPRPGSEILPVRTIEDIDGIIREKIARFFIPGKTAVLLSGGQDSAILASYLPPGTKAYTFKCLAPGAIDETAQAAKYAAAYSLDHEIIPIEWSDFEELSSEICRFDGVPFHSIEVQLVKAARHAKRQGIERLVIGESSDLVFGGMDKLLSQDWDFDSFVKRYIFCPPPAALKESVDVTEFFEPYRLPGGKIDFLRFMDEVFAHESSSSYMHAFEMENIEYLDPYSYMKMSEPLDLRRVRNGEPKYLIRELFAKRYPQIPVPDKIPMPRAMNQWLAGWTGPVRPEFIPGCQENMTGDQKWLVWILEKFLSLHEKA